MKSSVLTIIMVFFCSSLFAIIGPINGTMILCKGAETTLTDTTSGGTWSSSDPSVAEVGSLSGSVNGMAAGSATISYFSGVGYVTAVVTVLSTPNLYSITGGGSLCATGAGVHLGLSYADPGISYILYHETVPVDTVGGVGAAIDFGPFTIAGTYTVVGLNSANSCYSEMTGVDTVVVNSLPNVYAISGGGYYCVGDSGKIVRLSYSDTGISYRLFLNGTTPVDTISGTGSILNFGLHTTSGAYTIIATNKITGCENNMTGGVAIITSPNPFQYNLTGGGTQCAGGTGFGFTLSASNEGVNYQLYRGTVAVDTPKKGIGASLTFPREDTTGFYRVVATDTLTGCISVMNDTDTVLINALPDRYLLIGGGSFCAGGTGVPIGLGGSQDDTNIFYQLFRDGTPVNMPVMGNGDTLGFGVFSAAGHYTIIATDTATMCTSNMDTLLVLVDPLPSKIAGNKNVCLGTTSQLSDTLTGGLWISSNRAVATIGSTSGIVSSVFVGNIMITYTLPTGCAVTTTLSVDVVPKKINGDTTFCAGLPTLMRDSTSGGLWSSGNGTVRVASTSGLVTGVAGGTALITYSLPSGCSSTLKINLIPAPAPISGPGGMCIGSSIVLTDSSIGGSWSSSQPSVATIGTTGLVTSVMTGTTMVTYHILTGCSSTNAITVSPYPTAIVGSHTICQSQVVSFSDTIGGGAWVTSDSLAVVVGSTTGVVAGSGVGTALITYSLPYGCSATFPVDVVAAPAPLPEAVAICTGSSTHLVETISGGTWSSVSTGVATVDGTGLVESVSLGVTVISYQLLPGCAVSTSVSVTPGPKTITGNAGVCLGYTTSLSDSVSGGMWSDVGSGVVSVNGSTGVVAGIGVGTTVVTYTLSGCPKTVIVTVKPLPDSILGSATVCAGTVVFLADSSSAGVWSSSNSLAATIGSLTGTVSSLSAGTTEITYTLSATGCFSLKAFLVNAIPSVFSVTGGGGYCAGGAGRTIGLSGSADGISYQLVRDTSFVGGPLGGSDSVLHFGVFFDSGSYSVIATDLSTGCSISMRDTALITIEPLPEVFSVIGGGRYCIGSVGDPIVLSGSQTNVRYQMFNDTSVVGMPLVGTGSLLEFGLDSMAGTFKVLATNVVTGCASPMFDSAVVVVFAASPDSVTLVSLVGDTVCDGTSVTFSATPYNGGILPHYEWLVNGTDLGIDSQSIHYTPVNGAIVTVLMTSSQPCPVPASTFASLTLTVDTVYIPSVAISVYPGYIIKKGLSDTFVATVTGAGPRPAYLWKVNGSPVPGATSMVFVCDTLSDKDSVICFATGSGVCGLSSFNGVLMEVRPVAVGGISEVGDEFTIFPNPNKGDFSVQGKVGGAINESVNIEVTDPAGRKMYHSDIYAVDGLINGEVHLHNLASGIYFLNFRSGSYSKVLHFLVE